MILVLFLVNLSVLVASEAVEQEIECEVKALSEFWAGEESTYSQVIGCTFPENYSVTLQNTHLSNTANDSVRKLDFSNTLNFKFLPVNIAEKFPNLKKVKGYETGVEFLSYDNLRHLSKVEEFDLRRSNLNNIEENAFQDTPKMKSIAMSENKLTSLPDKLFSKLESLEDLYLRHNKISRLDSKIFASNKNLMTLDLSENLLKNIEPHTFDTLTELRTLNLAFNELTEIDSHIFAFNINVDYLELNDNKISSLDSHLLIALKELNTVSLSRNPLETFDFELFKENQLLREIFLEECKIRKVLNIETTDVMKDLERVKLEKNVCIDEDYDFKGLQFKLKRDVNKKCTQ